ncbi:MAG: zinc ribbon domain-containing protein [Gammaproteobacteria bacterium]|jgi:putative FmdB family regulatory protein|nr:zinc ribbon domain-containing protein [Gammaproteobacteria bacterium]
MPIYGYECTSCEHTFDVLQKMSDPKLLDCPDCGKATLRKQLSAPKFRLKGKGWYETDFKTGDKRNIAGDSEKKSTTKSKEADKSTGSEKSAKKADSKKSTDSKAKSA